MPPGFPWAVRLIKVKKVSPDEACLKPSRWPEGEENSSILSWRPACTTSYDHLLDGQDEDLADRGFDGRHEEAGCAWLAEHFGPTVTEPVRLHVAAKRYLCAVAPGYLAGLVSLPHVSAYRCKEARWRPKHGRISRAIPFITMLYGYGIGMTRPRSLVDGALTRTLP